MREDRVYLLHIQDAIKQVLELQRLVLPLLRRPLAAWERPWPITP